MQHHGNRGPSPRLPEPCSRQYELEKLVLLELVVDPPRDGDAVDDLAAILGLAHDELDGAVTALAVAGLAQRQGDRVVATEAARYFEHLWPVAL